uniref:Septin 9a n=1 Tax=Astyanax mexicanus TaxID=7994 RepID=A0A8B9GSQ3_ASTMX
GMRVCALVCMCLYEQLSQAGFCPLVLFGSVTQSFITAALVLIVLMILCQSGLGKSTLMNTLFKSKVSRKSVMGTAEERIPKTIEIKSISHDIEEKGVRMKLTVIDTPGFGDQINNENCWQPIMKFINDQYEQYLQEEINIERKKRIPDSRVHCCIYFIPPTGHCLRPLDVEFMRRLSKVVNIVPVIAKADTLTLEERDFFKKKIREELRANSIDVYPQKEFDEDAEDRLINEKIRVSAPYRIKDILLHYSQSQPHLHFSKHISVYCGHLCIEYFVS